MQVMAMHKIMYFRLGGRDVHVPRLIGAFLIFIALLMFFKAGATMVNSWDDIKQTNSCLGVLGASPEYTPCRDFAMQSLDISIRPDQTSLNSKQWAAALFGPIASLFFWLVILLLGFTLYKTGNFVVPIEETEFEVKRRPAPKRRRK